MSIVRVALSDFSPLFPVNTSVCASAYAVLKLATETASLAFSNCAVKIGMLIATKTPMIATNASSSADGTVLLHYLKDGS